MNTKISFRDVSQTFPLKRTTFTALDEVSLDIARRGVRHRRRTVRAAASPP